VLLEEEITARMHRDPGEIYRELTREFGEPLNDRVEARANPKQKQLPARLSPQQVRLTDLAGEKNQTILTRAASNARPSAQTSRIIPPIEDIIAGMARARIENQAHFRSFIVTRDYQLIDLVVAARLK
jgi:hypothetical protein